MKIPAYSAGIFIMGTENNNHFIKNCSLPRRLAAIFYDCILLSAVLFFSTLILLPFTHGQAIASGNLLFNFYIFCISSLYFTWQWTHGGQTLGMLAWKIKLVGINSVNVSWRKATIRLLLVIISLAAAGAGFFWSLFDPDKLTFHDRYSGTHLIIPD